MKLSKRQLKRIIREEYSRINRRRLISEAGEGENHSAEIQQAVSELRSKLEQRKERNLEFVEFMLNDFFMRLENLGEDDGEFMDDTYYRPGKVLEYTDTPFDLTEVDMFLTRPIDKVVDQYGLTISWNYSWT